MSTIDRLVQALDGKREGGSYRMECPCHGGHHLRVTPRDGKLLIFCFQGAEYRDIIRALEERGLWSQ